MFWVDTFDGGMVNLSHIVLIKIFDDDGDWIQQGHKVDDDAFYKVFCHTPTSPYKNVKGEELHHSHLLFRGKYNECNRFMDWIKGLLDTKFVNIPNNIFELESDKSWDSSNIPDNTNLL